MNGLRVYINPSAADGARGCATFYTRRADGPFYCWSYEERAGRWQVGRVHPPDLDVRGLRATNMRTVPPELQAKMTEHYLE